MCVYIYIYICTCVHTYDCTLWLFGRTCRLQPRRPGPRRSRRAAEPASYACFQQHVSGTFIRHSIDRLACVYTYCLCIR